MGLGVVDADGVGDLLQDDRLTRLGRGDYESALALADGRDQVDDPRSDGLGRGLQAQLLLGIEGGQLGELGAAPGALGVHAIDGLDADHGVVLDPAGAVLTTVVAPTLGSGGVSAVTDPTGHGVAGTQTVVLDELVGDVDVLGPGQIPGGAQIGVLVVGDIQDAGHRQENLILARLIAILPATVVVTVLAVAITLIAIEAVTSALAAPTAAPATLVVVTFDLVVAVAVPARALLRLDDRSAGGVGQVPHESGLGVSVVLRRVGAGLPGGSFLVLRGPGGGLDAPAAATHLVTGRALTALVATRGVASVSGLGAVGAFGAVAPPTACGAFLVTGGAGPVGQVDTQVQGRWGLVSLPGGAGGRSGSTTTRPRRAGRLHRLRRGCFGGGVGGVGRNGIGRAVRCAAGDGGGGAARLTDGGDELALSHAGDALEAHGAGKRVELGQTHGGKRGLGAGGLGHECPNGVMTLRGRRRSTGETPPESFTGRAMHCRFMLRHDPQVRGDEVSGVVQSARPTASA